MSHQVDPILRAAIAAMAEVGPSNLSISDVSRRAGVSRMTVYRRHGTLDRLVSDALTAEFADLLDDTRRQVVASNGRERIVRETLAIVSALLDHSLLRAVLEQDPAALLPLLVHRIGTGQQLLLDRLVHLVRAGIGDGSVRAGDPDLMALCVLTMAQPFVTGMAPLARRYPQQVLLAELGQAINHYLEEPG